MEQRKPFKQILSEVIGRKKGSEREIEYADEAQRISANDVYLKFKNSFSHEVSQSVNRRPPMGDVEKVPTNQIHLQ